VRDRGLWLLILTFPPLVLAIVVGVVLIVAHMPVVYQERRIAPGRCLAWGGVPAGRGSVAVLSNTAGWRYRAAFGLGTTVTLHRE
jgi:hypothetical protein